MFVFGREALPACTVIWHLADAVLTAARFTFGHTLMSVIIPHVPLVALTLFGCRTEEGFTTSFCTYWLANLIDHLVAGFTLTFVWFETRTMRRTFLRTDGRTEAIL